MRRISQGLRLYVSRASRSLVRAPRPFPAGVRPPRQSLARSRFAFPGAEAATAVHPRAGAAPVHIPRRGDRRSADRRGALGGGGCGRAAGPGAFPPTRPPERGRRALLPPPPPPARLFL